MVDAIAARVSRNSERLKDTQQRVAKNTEARKELLQDLQLAKREQMHERIQQLESVVVENIVNKASGFPPLGLAAAVVAFDQCPRTPPVPRTEEETLWALQEEPPSPSFGACHETALSFFRPHG